MRPPSDSPSAMLLAGRRDQAAHAIGVEEIGVDDEAVAAVGSGDRVVTVTRERLAQFRDVDIDGLSRRRGRRQRPRARRSGARAKRTRSHAGAGRPGPSAPSTCRGRAGAPSSSTSSGPRIRNSTSAFYRISSHIESPSRLVGGRCLIRLWPRSYRDRPRCVRWLAHSSDSRRTRSLTTVRCGRTRGATPRSGCRPRPTPLEPPLEYELRDLEPPSSARVTAELRDGRFTIATDQPHVKVAWRVSRRKEESK